MLLQRVFSKKTASLKSVGAPFCEDKAISTENPTKGMLPTGNVGYPKAETRSELGAPRAKRELFNNAEKTKRLNESKRLLSL